MNFLKGIREKLNPANALSGLAEMFLPQLGEALDKLSQPEAAGGMLKEGQEQIVFVVARHKGETKITICPIWSDEAVAPNKVLGKPAGVTSVQELLSQNINTDGGNETA